MRIVIRLWRDVVVNHPSNQCVTELVLIYSVLINGIHTRCAVENQSRRYIAPAPRLLDQVRESIRRHHYSYRTEQAYVHWIKRYILSEQPVAAYALPAAT